MLSDLLSGSLRRYITAESPDAAGCYLKNVKKAVCGVSSADCFFLFSVHFEFFVYLLECFLGKRLAYDARNFVF